VKERRERVRETERERERERKTERGRGRQRERGRERERKGETETGSERKSRLVTDPVFLDRIPIPQSRAKTDHIPHSVPLGAFGSPIRSDPISDPSIYHILHRLGLHENELTNKFLLAKNNLTDSSSFLKGFWGCGCFLNRPIILLKYQV
jgi:hypothetical protein